MSVLNNSKGDSLLDEFTTEPLVGEIYRDNDQFLKDVFALAALYRAYWLSLSRSADSTLSISTYFTSTLSNYLDIDIDEETTIPSTRKMTARIKALEKKIHLGVKVSRRKIPAIEVLYNGLDTIERRVMMLLTYASNFVESEMTVMEVIGVLEALGHNRSEIMASLSPDSRLAREGYITFIKDDILDTGRKSFMKTKVGIPDDTLARIFMGREMGKYPHEHPPLGRVVQPRFGLDRIVLPPKIMETLHLIIAQERHQKVLYDDWGFKDIIGQDHKGVKMLFHGPPGTGKSATAEAIAYELQCPLYIADFTVIVDSLVGETSKNITRMFATAKDKGYVLFIDEADALSSRRGMIRTSLDTEFNREINVLLNEIENFDGVLIMATNMADNLDPALARRMHFSFAFQTPDQRLRERLWRLYIPKRLPLSSDVSIPALARRYNMTGAEIKMAVINAARWALYRIYRSNGNVHKVRITMEDIVYAIDNLTTPETFMHSPTAHRKEVHGGYA